MILVTRMVNYYREIYGLNGSMRDLVKETLDLDGIEVYALPVYDMGFVELSAETETQIKQLDKQFTSRLIAYCERQKVEHHLLGPLQQY